MVALQRAAEETGCTLTDFVRNEVLMRQHMSPLSATLIGRFIDPLTAELEKTKDRSAATIVTGLVRLIEHRRAGIPVTRRADFRATLDEIDRWDTGLLEQLQAVVARQSPVTIGNDGTVDGRFAALLMCRVLEEYLECETT